MLSDKERHELHEKPANWESVFDCDGKRIRRGDKVVVVVEQFGRRCNADFAFCGIGKTGTVLSVEGGMAWFTHVEFLKDGKKFSVGCGEQTLRVLGK